MTIATEVARDPVGESLPTRLLEHGLLLYLQRDLKIESHWQGAGTHCRHTAGDWLTNLDRHREQLMPILASIYGADQARKWWVYWRVFFMSCAELFGYRAGSEWIVSHYLFREPA